MENSHNVLYYKEKTVKEEVRTVSCVCVFLCLHMQAL